MNHNSNLFENREIEDADLLFNNKFFKSAIILYWHESRKNIFKFLYKNNIEYDSTREAIKNIVVNVDDIEMIENIYILETIATLCEWDNCFSISYDDAEYIRRISLTINHKIRNHG